jgi:hypothetical protein
MPKKHSPTFVTGTENRLYAVNRAAKRLSRRQRLGASPVPLTPLHKVGDDYVRELDGALVPYKPYQVSRES